MQASAVANRILSTGDDKGLCLHRTQSFGSLNPSVSTLFGMIAAAGNTFEAKRNNGTCSLIVGI